MSSLKKGFGTIGRERVMLMMLENVVPEVMTGWASRLRQTWCQKVNAASGFNYKTAGTPVNVCSCYLGRLPFRL